MQAQILTPAELDALLAVARKHRVIDLTLVGVGLSAHIDYTEAFDAPPAENVRAGGWKRGPDLEE